MWEDSIHAISIFILRLHINPFNAKINTMIHPVDLPESGG